MPSSEQRRSDRVKLRSCIMAKTKVIICPYCGETQPESDRCSACAGLFEPLSRQATHNAMGPWFVRNPMRAFQPGCSYDTLRKMIERGQVTKYTIVRGPTTKQFWSVARHVPGVAHLLGYCHHCDASVDATDHGCHSCGVPFGAYLDRNYLGLPEVRPLPWETPQETAQEGPDSYMEPVRTAWHEPVESSRLSSFATDEELRQEATAGAAAAMGASGVGPSTPEKRGVIGYRISQLDLGSSDPMGYATSSAAALPHTSETMALSAGVSVRTYASRDERSEPALVRSLQRRLAQQQRTTRMMMIALGVVIVVGAMIFIALLGSRPDGVTTESALPLETTRSEPPARDDPSSHDREVARTSDPVNIAGNESSSASTTTAASAVMKAVDARHDHVMKLISQGEDAARPFSERDAALTEADRLVDELRAEGTQVIGGIPIDELAVRIQRAIKRLSLRDLFPES